MQKLIGGLRPRACRCAQCFTPHSSAAARQTGSLPVYSPRQLLSNTTILCTSICTVAAYVDAASKNRRRGQWDEAIERVERDVLATLARNNATEARLHGTALMQKVDMDVIGLHNENVAPEHDAERIPELETMAYAPVVTEAVDMQQTTDKRVVSGVSVANYQPSRQTWTPTPSGAESVLDTPIALLDTQFNANWTHKKTAVVNIATKSLQNVLLGQLLHDLSEPKMQQELFDRIIGKGSYVPDGRLRDRLATMLRRTNADIQKTKHELEQDLRAVWASPHYIAQDEVTSYPALTEHCQRIPDAQEIQTLDSRLRAVFAGPSKCSLDRQYGIALVCDLLATAKTAPPLSTYNELLNGLSRWHFRHTFENVAFALRRSHLRPDSTTLSIIMRHFASNSNKAAFERWLGFIRGEGVGLSLARPTSWSGHVWGDNASRLARADRIAACNDKKARIVRARPDAELLKWIVAGKLKYQGVDETIRLCDELHADGWPLFPQSLRPLMEHCVETKDVQTGQIILEWMASQDSLAPIADAELPTALSMSMLKLCSGNRSKEETSPIVRQVRRINSRPGAFVLRYVVDKSGQDDPHTEPECAPATEPTVPLQSPLSVSAEQLAQTDSMLPSTSEFEEVLMGETEREQVTSQPPIMLPRKALSRPLSMLNDRRPASARHDDYSAFSFEDALQQDYYAAVI